MELLVQLGAVFASAGHNFLAAGMFLDICCDVVDLAFIDCPAVVFLTMLRHLAQPDEDLTRVFDQRF